MNAETFTITDLEKMVAEHEASAIRVKTIINELCAKGGLPPRYAAADLQRATGGAFSSIRSDQFHGRPLATCVREYLDMRRGANMGPASTVEIFDALREGAYEVGAKNEQIARISMYNSLNKNPAFYKLPNKKWGLREWYPAAKNLQVDDDDSDADVKFKKPVVTSPKVKSEVKRSGPAAKPDSVPSMIQQLLESDPDKQWKIDEIIASIPSANRRSSATQLVRLKEAGKVENTGRGLWKAKISAVNSTAS